MNPQSLYQSCLNAVSRAVLADDFAAYLAMIDLPYLVRTPDADFVLTSPAELEPTFRALSQGLALRGVSHYERICRDAQFQRPDRIVGRHYTHMIAGGNRINAPHAASAALVLREAGNWRFTEASYPLAQAEWPLSDGAMFNLASPAPHTASAGRLS